MSTRRKSLHFLLLFVLVLTCFSGTVFGMPAADGKDPITYNYGDHTFTKVSNPGNGEREPDGINTNDTTGFPQTVLTAMPGL